MRTTQTEILFYGLKPTKRLRRFIERKIEKWALRHSKTTGSVPEAACRVCIEKEEECLSCQLQVQLGPQHWVGHEIGKNVQEALLNALARLIQPNWKNVNAT